MSERLIDLINEVILREGRPGKTRLALLIERSEQMIDRYISRKARPSRNIAYKLALGCGCDDSEAYKLASEYGLKPSNPLIYTSQPKRKRVHQVK